MRAGWTGPLILAASIVAAAFCQPAPCQAWDWRDAPVDLRIGLAFDRQASTFTDVVGLSASGAYPYGSSVNPASDDLVRTPPNDFTLAGTGTLFYIPFARGASVTAKATSVSGRLPGAGTVTATYSLTESHDARSAQGDTYELDSHDVTIGYSHLVLPWLALGGEFKITDSVLKFGSSVLGFPLDTTTESLGYDARAGVVFAPQKNWLIGLMAGAGWSYARTGGAVLIPDAFGGPIPVRFDTFTRSINVRAGAGWRPSEKFGTYVDWQYLRLWTDEDSVTVGRSFAGIEYLPIEALALRVGGSIDTAGKTNVSAGIGFYGLKHALFEIAYVYNAFPELRREFGGATCSAHRLFSTTEDDHLADSVRLAITAIAARRSGRTRPRAGRLAARAEGSRQTVRCWMKQEAARPGLCLALHALSGALLRPLAHPSQTVR